MGGPKSNTIWLRQKMNRTYEKINISVIFFLKLSHAKMIATALPLPIKVFPMENFYLVESLIPTKTQQKMI
jgi:hypothetical protein